VTESGLSTSSIYNHDRAFQLELDLVRHRCVTRVAGGERHFPLKPMSVARFYRDLMADLHEEGIDASIVRMPNEIPDAVPFDVDHDVRPTMLRQPAASFACSNRSIVNSSGSAAAF
jgi:Family of unknown function (DUF5996)